MTTMAIKECSNGAVKHRPRLETRIYATEIGIRRSFSNTNYHELTMKAEGLASDSENEVAIIINGKLYGQLHGNYMLKEKE